jgi:hypothetical protein
MENKIKKAMSENRIASFEEAEFAIEFVRDLLELQIEHTEKTEPYATNWIERAKNSARMVSDLPEFINEHEIN